jgi:putative ABC transport system permease protein
VLYIAVMTGIGLGTMIINNVDDVKKWYQRTLIAGDFTVRVMLPGSQPGLTAEMPDWKQLRDELEHEVRGIESLDTIGFLNAQAAGHAIVVVAREFADKEALPLDLYQGWAEEVADALRRGEVVVGTVLAQRSGLKVGDFIEFQTKEGPKKARIAALAVDYLVGGYIVYMRRELASRLFRNDAVNAFAVRAVPDNQVPRAEVEAALRRFANERGLMLHSYAELNQMLDHVLAGVVGSLWGVLVLGFVVAAFGVANTLTMNVLEQTRELALLRVVAMTRRQVRKMILAQAAMIGLVGLGLGTIAGVVTAYSISASMMPLLGYPVDFILHGPLLVGCFLMGLLLVLAAAWLPAERAARLDLLIALQYE